MKKEFPRLFAMLQLGMNWYDQVTCQMDTERNLNVHKTFRRSWVSFERHMYVQFTSCVQRVENGNISLFRAIYNRKFGRRIKVFIDLSNWLVLTSVPIEREEDAGRMGANW